MSKVAEKKKEEKSIAETYKPPMSMYDKFEKALKMDQKGTPRSTIVAALDVSSATFYKWIKNPKYWADMYKAKPDQLKRTTGTIIAGIKKQGNSLKTIKKLLKDLDLNDYELEFVYHYIDRRNSTEAMLHTLPPDKELTKQAAKMKALKLMKRKHIRAAIDRVLQWELEGIHMTLANDVVGQLYSMAFYDPAMFIDLKDGRAVSRFESIDDVPPEYRCCVTGFKTTFHPKDPKKTYVEIQLVDKFQAMRELMQYANMYEDNNKGLASLGEGLKKIGELLDKNKVDTVPMENVTPAMKTLDAGIV